MKKQLLQQQRISIFILFLTLSLGGVIAFQGCYSVYVATPQGRVQTVGDTTFSTSSWFWSSVTDYPIVGDDTYHRAMTDVIISQNFGQKLVSIVTLGIYVPFKVHCYFAPADQTIP